MQSNIRDDVLCYVGDAHADRIMAVVGDNAVSFDEDWVAPKIVSDAPAGWTVTLVEAGAGESTVTAGAVSGGALVLTTDNAENDGINMCAQGEAFLPSATSSVWFYIKLQASEATQSDLFVGLSQTDTAILGNLPPRVGFRKVDGSASIAFETEGTGTTSISSVATLVADTDIELEFCYDKDSGTLRYYVDGVRKGEITPGANLPTTELTPAIHFLTGAAAAETLTVDRLRAFQIGR
jgi:hypothetical protein